MYYKKGININNIKQMFEFINGHFTYDTLNSWNRLESIANNVKLYNLHLDGDWSNAMGYLFDEDDIGGLQYQISKKIRSWENIHPGYSLGFNGRSGGYLVIYNMDREGRVNFRSILPESISGYDSYEDWKESVKEYGENVSDYKSILQETTRVIQDFDKLCDTLRDIVNTYSKMNYEEDRNEFEIANEEN